jgi:UDP-GlcNAc:undecaprenyl-phosphate GlcNAc-1-phosphate transferase
MVDTPASAPLDSPTTPGKSQAFKKVLPLVVLVALVVGGVFVAANLARWLGTPDTRRKVDVIVVPAGKPDVRVEEAVDLLERGEARTIWVVASSDGPVLHERKAIASYAASRGVKKDEIEVLNRTSKTLVRDALLVARKERHEERRLGKQLSLAVVTSPLEIARTRLVFSRQTGHRVSVWSDKSRFARAWVGLASESARVLSAVALLGPGPELRSAKVPVRLPLRGAAGGFLLAMLVGAACRPLARRLGFVSVPRLLRAHSTPTPMLGGLAVLAGLAGGVIAAGGVRLGALGAAAAAGVVVISVVGLVDDITGLGAGARIIWATLAGSAAWLLGLRALVFPGGGVGDVGNALLTILWFVAVNVAVNWLDNLDGVTGGVGAAAAGAIAVAAMLSGQFVVAIVAAAVAGACLGYLVHNFPPARLFMGDMGASGIGFALAALGLALKTKSGPPLSMAAPVIALGVPAFDMALVTISRIAAGGSPSVGGTDHTAHRLLARGLSVRQSAAFMWGAQVVLGVMAVVVARSQGVLGWVVFVGVVLGGIASLAVFLRMAPWTPPHQLEASEDVVNAVHRAMRALRSLEEAVGDEAWRLSDPRAARSAQETLKRLERVRRLLETPGPEPKAEPKAEDQAEA